MNHDHANRVAEIEQAISDIEKGKTFEPRRGRDAAIKRALETLMAKRREIMGLATDLADCYSPPKTDSKGRLWWGAQAPAADETAVISPALLEALQKLKPVAPETIWATDGFRNDIVESDEFRKQRFIERAGNLLGLPKRSP